MTHLLDSSALLAHYLGEPGAERVQALFEDTAVVLGTSILALFEVEWRLLQLGLEETARAGEITKYRASLDEILVVDGSVHAEGIRLRAGASTRLSAMDTLIAASASLRNATLVHRDPHFLAIPRDFLRQETLPEK